MARPRRNYRIRKNLAKIMSDGKWRSAAEVGLEMSKAKFNFTSPNQLGSLLSNTPGFISKKASERWRFGLGLYKLDNPTAFSVWIERKKP